MNAIEHYSGARPWYLAVLLSALAVGCGGGGADQVAGASGPVAYALHSGSSDGDGNGNACGNGDQSDGSSDHGNGGGSGGPVIVPGAQSPVNLGAAGTFTILSETGVTDVYASVINGDVGASPLTSAAIGLTCPEVVTGVIYSVDAAGPVPCVVTNATLLTTAVGAMKTAYTDAAGRTSPGFTELGAGEIGGLTLAPGLYKWGTGVLISSDVTLVGGPNDVWIFQIAGTLTQASAVRVTLTGGALAKNIIW